MDTIILDLPSLRYQMSVSVLILVPFLFLTQFPSSDMNDHDDDDAAAAPFNIRTPIHFHPVLVFL